MTAIPKCGPGVQHRLDPGHARGAGSELFSPVICDSPLARTRFSASGKLASGWFLGAVRWLGSPAWSVAAGHSRLSSWPTISMDRARSNTDTSNRLIADDQLDAEVEAIASRLARFDRDAIARTKSYVDQVTVPDNSELGPPWNDFFRAVSPACDAGAGGPAPGLGLNTDGEFERSLGRRLVESLPDA